jgi:hypothetical protein
MRGPVRWHTALWEIMYVPVSLSWSADEGRSCLSIFPGGRLDTAACGYRRLTISGLLKGSSGNKCVIYTTIVEVEGGLESARDFSPAA